ncbi:sensor histidine kinase [Paenibacillus sp. GCM10023248]|uniref:cache domain-containing sensor histidine kinase n=1 Tax=unclassified Paenibacillus TaxID=185978 RepID=UPI00237864F3|nr:sensor histidine kinase [Paenibacillus sp. MAHUQ-63]MDD9271715.1 histidine kinase [Paenibacillus sp. MAHUQ-63]
MRHWIPQTLKYRLFLAFLLIILLPIILLNMTHVQKFETLMREQVSSQNLEQMTTITSSLGNLLSVSEKTFTLIEQDSFLTAMLKNPESGLSYTAVQQKLKIEEKFNAINNSVFLANSYVYYTILDADRHVYMSYGPNRILNYETIAAQPRVQEAFQGKSLSSWLLEEGGPDSVFGINPSLLTMYKVLRDENNRIYAVIRIGVDFRSWLRSAIPSQVNEEQYVLASSEGQIHARSSEGNNDAIPNPLQVASWEPTGSQVENNHIISYSKIPNLNWFLIKSVPTKYLFQKVNQLQQSYILTTLFIAVLFIVMTFLISTTITRPLQLLQRKMSDVVRRNLKIQLPEESYKGEILTFVQAFNNMVRDVENLLHRLKEEERNKESMRFQMLLSQMNPHFLLNTLNTVKWLAIEIGNKQIPEVCESLGKLLEAGIRLDVDLIHLEHEIELAQSYISIQKLRYDREFDVAISCDPELRFALVPKLSLQPLIENSIYHGFANLDRVGRIDIRFRREEDELVIEVEDNGVGLKNSGSLSSTKKGNGIALKNLEERLALLYRKQGKITLESLEMGTLVRLRMLLLLSPPYLKGESLHVDGSLG